MWAHWAASAGQATAATTALRGLAVAKAHQTLEVTSTQAMITDAYNLQRLSRFHSALASAKALKRGKALLLSLSDLAKAGATVAEQLNRATPAHSERIHGDLAKRAAPWIAAGATNGMARLSFGAGLRDLVRKTKRKQPPNLPSEVLSGVVLLSLNQATHTHYALVALAKSREHLTKPWLKLVLGALQHSAEETAVALNVLATQRALGAMATPLKGLSRVLQRGTAALIAAQTWLLTGGDAGQFDANLERYRQSAHVHRLADERLQRADSALSSMESLSATCARPTTSAF